MADVSAPDPQFFPGKDGAQLAYREIGAGRPVVLIHGLFSNARTNWLKYGHAQTVAAQGFRVIMPDLRGHGDSAAPHDPAAYPPDVLADDGEALVAHLGLADYDLGGYSLGGRTTVRMLVRGARPGRAILSGMGLEGILDTGARGDFFRRVLNGAGSHAKFSNEWFAEAFLRANGGDPRALINIMNTFVDTSEAELRAITVDTLVLTGADDQDNGSAAALAAVLPRARYAEIPGNHMSAVARPEMGREIAAFLANGRPASTGGA